MFEHIHPPRAVLLASVCFAFGSLSCAYSDSAVAFCQANGRVDEILSVGDRIFVAGEFSALIDPDGTSHVRHGLGACDLPDGRVAPWDPQINPGADVQALAVSSDQSTVFAGGLFTRSGPNRTNAAAFDVADGAAVQSWKPSPGVSKVTDMIVAQTQQGQRVYMGGWFGVRLYHGTEGSLVGQQIGAFAPSVTGGVWALAMSPEHDVLYIGGGNLTAINGTPRQGAAAVDALTGQTHPFAPALTDPGDNNIQIFDMVVDGQQIYICGDWWQTEGIGKRADPQPWHPPPTQRNLNRFDRNTGLVDRTWWPFTDGGVQACALHKDAGNFVIGGHFKYVNGKLQKDVAALATTTPAVDFSTPETRDWAPDSTSSHGAYAVSIDHEGAVIVGGDDRLATTVNGIPVRFLARFTLEL